jgi:hypothetical protein
VTSKIGDVVKGRLYVDLDGVLCSFIPTAMTSMTWCRRKCLLTHAVPNEEMWTLRYERYDKAVKRNTFSSISRTTTILCMSSGGQHYYPSTDAMP